MVLRQVETCGNPIEIEARVEITREDLHGTPQAIYFAPWLSMSRPVSRI
jgi:hypothetical protein